MNINRCENSHRNDLLKQLDYLPTFESEESPRKINENMEWILCSGDATYFNVVGEKSKKAIYAGIVRGDKVKRVNKSKSKVLDKRYCASLSGGMELADELNDLLDGFKISSDTKVYFTSDGGNDVKSIPNYLSNTLNIKQFLDWKHIELNYWKNSTIFYNQLERRMVGNQLLHLLWQGKKKEAMAVLDFSIKDLEKRYGKKSAKKLDKFKKYRQYLNN